MLKTTETLIEHGLEDRAFATHDLKRIFGGTRARIYGLVNKAITKGEIIVLKKGLYVLNQKYNRTKISQYYLASQIEPHSYISLETALSFHGWIPEKVTVVSNAIKNGRYKNYITPLGEYEYFHIPTRDYSFLVDIQRETVEGKPFLIASGLRALLDLVYERKLDWQGIEFLTHSLRIERDKFASINSDNYIQMQRVYKSKRVLNFLRHLMKEFDE